MRRVVFLAGAAALASAWTCGGGGDEEIDALRERVAVLEAQVAALQTELTSHEHARVPRVDTPPPVEVAAWVRVDPDGPVVLRELVDTEQLLRVARFVPHRGPDGEPDGFRVSGVRAGSPVSQLGFANGDILHGVNGLPVTDPASALEAWTAVRSAERLEFQVTRRGEPLAIAVRVE
jgi:type II secretory pathway component PulC